MKKIKTFFYVLKNSLYKPNYYKDILKAPFSFSAKFFLFFFFLTSLTYILLASFFLIQKVSPILEKIKKEVPNIWPEELEVKIENKQAYTNVEEPYFIPLKPEWFPKDLKEALNNQPIYNILVIDTQATAEDIKKYQTAALLTKNSISFLQYPDEIRTQTFSKLQDLTINQHLINNVWQKTTPYFKYIIPGSIALIFILLPIFTFLGKFFYLLFFSLLSLFAAKLLKLTQINYLKALQINLHAITLPTFATAAFYFLGVPPQIPLFHSIILFIYNLIIFVSIREQKNH